MTGTGHGVHKDLATSLSALARTVQHEDNVEKTLQAIVNAAVGTVPDAQYAALSVVERRRQVHTRAGTDDLVYRVDQVQYDTGEGPCLDAMYEHLTVHLPDMTREQRWPRFTHRAAELGVASMLAFQLYVHEDNLGAQNLYSAESRPSTTIPSTWVSCSPRTPRWRCPEPSSSSTSPRPWRLAMSSGRPRASSWNATG
jgi:hypothetical protein